MPYTHAGTVPANPIKALDAVYQGWLCEMFSRGGRWRTERAQRTPDDWYHALRAQIDYRE